MLGAKIISSVFLKFLCVAGFMYQVTTVSRTFFSYKTTSKVLLNSQEARSLPNMQLCMRFTDVMDLDSLNRKEKTSFRRSNEFLEVADMQANITIKSVHEFVPSANETITRCTYRNPDGLLMLIAKQDECYRQFSVKRFTEQSFVCYTFKFTGKVNFTSKQVASSLDHPNLLYGVSLNPKFSGADLIHVTIFYGEYAIISKRYAALINRLTDFMKQTARSSVYVFAYSVNNIKLLEPPYDTNCRHSTDEQDNLCHETCLAPLEKELDRITFSTITHGPLDKKLISFYDLNDKNRSALIKQYFDHCSNKCDKIACVYNHTITFFDLAQRIPGSNEFRAVARTPKAPGLDVKFEAKLSLMEFIIYICSCVGIWFGLSVVSINPFEALLRKRIPTSCQELRRRLLPAEDAAFRLAANSRRQRN